MNNNKLIAEFMGMEFSKGAYYRPLYNSGDWIPQDELRYHTSWDWLMPVVEKIENGGLDPHETIATALESRVIEDVYNEVVDTIKRYNNEEKEKIQDRVCRV